MNNYEKKSNGEDGILVSVIIPTFSRNITLKSAINSVLNQTHRNIEVIVVDDNPPESEWRKSSELIMSEYSDDKRVVYVKNPCNLGGGAARTAGINASNGEYIAFLDDDDEYLSDKIQKQLEVFLSRNDEKLALVYCFAKFIDKDGNVIWTDKREFSGNCLYEAMEQNCIAATSQWMVTKEALEKIGGFADVVCKQDSQTILRLLKEGYKIDVVPEELSIYRPYRVGNKVSGVGKKNIEGELLYRTECRKLYYLLEDWQILNVEYKFAEILYKYFRINGIKELYKHERKVMFDINPKRAYIFILKRVWHKIKK